MHLPFFIYEHHTTFQLNFTINNLGGLILAIYHLNIKIISRGKGKSAVAAAAYRAAEKITNEYDGITHDYTKKSGVVHKEILLPENAPNRYINRDILWNSVEKIERYKTAQLAREIEIALPVELTREQNISLVQQYVKDNFVSAGMCADISIHDTGTGNPHAHILLTMRPIERDGRWGQKSYTVEGRKVPTVDWNEHDRAEEWRSAWAEYCNNALRLHGHDITIDHRSFERQGITDQIPTIHLGVAAHQMEKRGIKTERGNINREIMVTNNLLRQLKARITKLEKWIDEESKIDEPPTLADVISDILTRRDKEGRSSRYEAINNLKQAADMLNFLTENKIMDLDGLHKFIITMHNKQSDIRDKLKPMERRLKTLEEHLKQSELYFEHRDIYRMYKAEKPKHQERFYENNRMELTLYEAAERYLKGVMNGRTTIPTGAWKKEYASLTKEKNQLNSEYVSLKDEVSKVEKISRSVQDILYQERQREQPTRKHLQSLER